MLKFLVVRIICFIFVVSIIKNSIMKQITILPEDFNSVAPLGLNGGLTREFMSLYNRPGSCPIAKAVIRATGFETILVDSNGIRIEGVEYDYPKVIGIDEVVSVCTKALKNGKAVLKLGINIPINK
jgi:hypothetical protein